MENYLIHWSQYGRLAARSKHVWVGGSRGLCSGGRETSPQALAWRAIIEYAWATMKIIIAMIILVIIMILVIVVSLEIVIIASPLTICWSTFYLSRDAWCATKSTCVHSWMWYKIQAGTAIKFNSQIRYRIPKWPRGHWRSYRRLHHQHTAGSCRVVRKSRQSSGT